MIKSSPRTINKQKYLRDVLYKDFKYLLDSYDSINEYVDSLNHISIEKIEQFKIPEIALTDTLIKKIISLDHCYIGQVSNPSYEVYVHTIKLLKKIIEEEKIIDSESLLPKTNMAVILAGTNSGKSMHSLSLLGHLMITKKHTQNILENILSHKDCPTNVLWILESNAPQYIELIKKHKNYNNRASGILQEIAA